MYFCGFLHNNNVKSPNLRFWRQRKRTNFESFILYSTCEAPRTNRFLGYFAHIVRRWRDGLISKNLWHCNVIFWGDFFVDVDEANRELKQGRRRQQRERFGHFEVVAHETGSKPCWITLWHCFEGLHKQWLVSQNSPTMQFNETLGTSPTHPQRDQFLIPSWLFQPFRYDESVVLPHIKNDTGRNCA